MVNAQFGQAVAISGDIIVVSAPNARIQGYFGVGFVYVFHRNQGGSNRWGRTAKLHAEDFVVERSFGRGLGFDGNTIVASTTSSTYVFGRMDARGVLWTSQGKLVASDGVTGFASAVDGDTIVGSAGATAYIFQRSTTGDQDWRESLKLTASDGVNFGSIAVKGDTLVVGTAFSYSSGRTGVLSVFHRDFGGPDHWGMVDRVSAGDTEIGDYFGTRVAIGDGDFLVGASSHSDAGSPTGAAYVFNLACGNGMIDADEQCDDRNALGRDGCSTRCMIENGFACIQEPSLCFRDCNDNGVDDAEDVADRISPDCNENGIPDECEDCNGNSVIDAEDLVDLSSYDCNANCIPDECEIAAGSPGPGGPFFCTLDCDPDCNQSGIPDACELTTNDCDVDGVPDECETDCNENEFPDDCDLRLGTSTDCNENGIPDECEIDGESAAPGGPFFCYEECDPDCNESGFPDACALADNDCNGDGIPDECSICAECFPNTQNKVVASDASRDDMFGIATAMSGDLAIIGAPNRGDTCSEFYPCPLGGAYIFHRDEYGWRETAQLMSGETVGASMFGYSVAIHGETAIVGAPFDDNAADRSGAAYVFRHDGDPDHWDMVAKLVPDDMTEYFGFFLSINGDTVVVGAPYAGAGAAYVFQRDWGGADQWGQVTELSASGARNNDFFGGAVFITGDWVFIGAEGEDSACPNDFSCNSGAVYVFHRHKGGQNAWGSVSKITAEDAERRAAFGASVAAEGATLVVGSPGTLPPKAYVFQRDVNWPFGWLPIADLVTTESVTGIFGRSVSLAGNIAAVGAGKSVHVFHRDRAGADRWGEVSALVPHDPKTIESFGNTLSISGQTVLVGTSSDFESPAWIGSAYFIELMDTTCDCDCNGVLDACELAENDCNVDGILDTCQSDCNQNNAPDDCDVFEGRSVDCDGNGLPDECDISAGSEAPGGPFFCEADCDVDCNLDGIPDGCQPDCNDNGVPDDCDLRDGISQDCNSNDIPDECETDCNENESPDDCDLMDGTSEDCNLDGIPDECQPDCNQNGVPDVCELIDDVGFDCNHNGVPDDCDTDCNQNTVPDDCEVLDGSAVDCNENGVPDECEIAVASVPGGPFFCTANCDADCNRSGVPDACELVDNDCNANLSPDECDDCNHNGIPDHVDVDTLASLDCNDNCTPDECEIAAASQAPGAPFFCTSECDPDCNGTGIPDSCEVSQNDCNGNGRPDECEIHVDSTASGGPFYCLLDCDLDCNGSGVPDACEFIDDDCNGDGHADTCGVPIDCNSTESWKIAPHDVEQFDRFGASVAISGRHAVLGNAEGDAYIFRLAGNEWEEVTNLVPSVPSSNFGLAVAIHGNLAIVGAQATGSVIGSAYVFEQDQADPDCWTEIARLISSDGSLGRFGRSVDIWKDTAIVGADLFNNQGAAYVFQRHAGGENTWSEMTRIVASDGERNDEFGTSVGISGDSVIVGARKNYEDSLLWSGSAYIFSRDKGGSDNWGQVQKLKASNPGWQDYFGSAVAISGDLAIVGSPSDDNDENGVDSGSAFIFEASQTNPGAWFRRAKLTARYGARSDRFGAAVAIDGEIAVVGAVGHAVAGPTSGAGYLFQRHPNTLSWRQMALLSRFDGKPHTEFASAVSVSGDLAILGSSRDDGACSGDDFCWSGAAYIFPLADDDCNCNGTADVCDIARHVGIDCNGNLVLDSCEVISDGDFDSDGIVEVEDHAGFADCLSGPGLAPVPVSPKCVGLCLDAFDFDTDGDVDLTDWGRFQESFAAQH